MSTITSRPPLRTTAAWPIEFGMECFGVRLGIRCQNPSIGPLLERRLAPGRKPTVFDPSGPHFSLVGEEAPSLYFNRRRIACADSWEEAVELLESRMQIFIGEHAPGLVFLHAGVVRWRQACLIIPGRSFSGKSTLVAALLQERAEYLSDEFAVIDAGGNIHPYPRLVSLRRPGRSTNLRASAESMGGTVAQGPARPGVILLTHYRPLKVWSPRRASPSEAILQLARHCLPIRSRPSESLDALIALVKRTQVFAGDRGDTADMIPRLAALLDEEEKQPHAIR